jgi:ferrous iron transport protein B
MSQDRKSLSIVLAGNPNAGKTTIFNYLTGTNHHVGNYPGVTVEKKEGTFTHKESSFHVVDLPGTYSLTTSSLEEKVARDFLINETPDVVVQVVDAASLERNLYLTVQLLELGQNVVIALNMMDVALRKGLDIDIDMLSSLLDVPIVQTIGSSGKGLPRLLDRVIDVVGEDTSSKKSRIRYGTDLGREIKLIEKVLDGIFPEDAKPLIPSLPEKSWVAIKLLERDEEVTKDVSTLVDNGADILSAVERAAERLESIFGDPSEIVLADKRYGFISGACQEAVQLTVERRHRFSDKIDDILAHRILGLPIFFFVVYCIFWVTFTVGEPGMELIESGVSSFGLWVSSFWPKGSPSMVRSLLVEGIISGVGGVLVFLPNIVLLFMGISFLEDTGYIARAAFLTDWMMHKIGLHGRSFIPMILGFGCTVPAIMATRTLESRRDRLTTMFVLPLMSCSARFPIYTLIIPAFFPQAWQAPALWGIYFLGVLLAVCIARLLRKTVLSGSATPFVMELPIYRLPTVRGVVFHMWQRAKGYLEKAGTIILAASIAMWLIQAYPVLPGGAAQRELELSAARESYITSLKELSGNTSGSDSVFVYLVGELEASEASDRFYEWEDGYKSGHSDFQSLKKRLLKDPQSERLGQFLRLRDALLEIDSKYSSIEDQPISDVAAVVRQGELKQLQIANGKAFVLADRFLNEVQPGYKKQVQDIERKYASLQLNYSIAGRIGSVLEPLLKPIGFDKRIATGLIGAFAAKEMFVAQMGIIASVNTEDEGVTSLRSWMRENYSPVVGANLLIFCLIATPCMATCAVMRRESGSWKWAALQLGGLTLLAYCICLIVYQVHSLF